LLVLQASPAQIWTIDQDYFFDNIVLAASDDVPSRLRQAWESGHKAAEVGDLAKWSAE
jgi:hypothetical protein